MAAASGPDGISVEVDVAGLGENTANAPGGSDAPGAPERPGGSDSPGGDLGALAALARLGLAARRTGHRVRLRGAAPGLRGLLELAGLAGEFEWEPEEGEEMRGVEE